ncbi:prepilin-type N-terminal cleavage/methylation domain-containing protein [Methylovulum sp.]|uniref:prepilin-type N-terminal cleavage/methylation domain-containing protein n=1 Tax=Methylovulum sp. TaxID=1916980 RepID=UPI0026222AC0|nr:prepilin-type N-terminal cleavage/methylation domain-containing protein [Methylovulum sp.]MDD5123598.1 prepilin-type N-terminal cleavage/methylation domain-containing protein [Methylovulum sp.]
MIFCTKKNNHNGFTLMEVLVVLVLVSLISGLLMQGFGYVLRLRFNVTQQIKKQRIQQLQEHWYRNLVTGIIVNTREEKALFQGSESVLQGQSINTLTAPAGVPQAFTLTLSAQENTIVLRYRITEKEEWRLGQWTAQKASFSYLDNQGNWVPTWPPKMGAVTQQLPEAIQLQIENIPNPVNWIVSIPSKKNPKPGIEDFL